jgi:hypothetical protein
MELQCGMFNNSFVWFYFSQKACQSHKSASGFETKTIFLNVLLVLMEILDSLGILLPHDGVWIAGVLNRSNEYYSIIWMKFKHAQKNVHLCTFFCACVVKPLALTMIQFYVHI